MVDDFWAVLQMTPSIDKTVIKQAYARQLKQHKPEQDPQGYQQLRAAYDRALAYSRLDAAPQACDTPVEQAASCFVAHFMNSSEDERATHFEHLQQAPQYQDFFYKQALSSQLLQALSQQIWTVDHRYVLYQSIADEFAWFEGGRQLEPQACLVQEVLDDLYFFECLEWGHRQSWRALWRKSVFVSQILFGGPHAKLCSLAPHCFIRKKTLVAAALMLQTSRLFASMTEQQQAIINKWASSG